MVLGKTAERPQVSRAQVLQAALARQVAEPVAAALGLEEAVEKAVEPVVVANLPIT